MPYLPQLESAQAVANAAVVRLWYAGTFNTGAKL